MSSNNKKTDYGEEDADQRSKSLYWNTRVGLLVSPTEEENYRKLEDVQSFYKLDTVHSD